MSEKYNFALCREMDIHVPWLMTYYWKACWTLITPVLVAAILVMQFIHTSPIRYGNYVFPETIQLVGWIISGASAACVPLGALWQLGARYKEGKDIGWRAMFKPTKSWRPASKINIDPVT